MVRGPVLLYVPTAFTPNNDGMNDAFKVIGSQIMNYELWIMNRWGELVFHSTSLDDVWVGDVQGGTHYAENGIYNWLIRLKGYKYRCGGVLWCSSIDALNLKFRSIRKEYFCFFGTMKANINSFRGPFIVVTTLFFMWGFITVMVDALVPRLKDVFELTLLQAGMVQFAWFAAYGLLSIPGGNLIERIGYKRGILVGLSLACAGMSFVLSRSSDQNVWPFFTGSLCSSGRDYVVTGCCEPLHFCAWRS